ncbi:hypothetical protein Glove_318g44 [Diversispora epigaea]|uniref:Uncharacterized protein n=1 Tax=Diversispora epigaea TaxID=1348612 RepID=A0A397HQ00_9GLOM|nr:hypothetical protein Glove_318g44 [Diversispora epigaea]
MEENHTFFDEEREELIEEAGESAHANINRDGCNLSLLTGIIRECDFDKRSWESIHVNQQYNVLDSYRNKSDLARSIQAEKRTEKRRKGKQPVLPSNKTKKKKNNSNENDENLQIDQQQNRNVILIKEVGKVYINKSDLARSIQAEKRTEKRRKGKQPVLPSNKTKKKKNNSNENDENLQIDQQQNRVALEKLNIQKQINDEPEREITLKEKRKQLMN